MNILHAKMMHAAKVKAMIKEANLTSEAVAMKLKHPNGLSISKQRFSDMINGRRPKDLELFSDQISEILNCRRNEILFLLK